MKPPSSFSTGANQAQKATPPYPCCAIVRSYSLFTLTPVTLGTLNQVIGQIQPTDAATGELGGGCQVETSRIMSVAITTTEERSCIAIKPNEAKTFADWFHALSAFLKPVMASCLSHILKEVFFPSEDK